MYLCVRVIDFASFYDFSIRLWNFFVGGEFVVVNLHGKSLSFNYYYVTIYLFYSILIFSTEKSHKICYTILTKEKKTSSNLLFEIIFGNLYINEF
jgi:hypothetical protein